MEINRSPGSENSRYKPKELAQLSMIQIITLHAISKYSKPIIRHSLLQEINASLVSKEIEILSPEQAFSESLQNIPKTLISPSSFYTSLEVLEKKGLVAFNRNKKGKVESVERTELTHDFIDFIHQYFLFNMINDREISTELFQKLINILQSQKINKGNLFSIFPFDEPKIKFIEYITKNFKTVYLLGNEKVKERFLSGGSENITFSKVKNGQIREPDNDFDISLIQGFNPNFDFYDISFKKLLDELIRITKPNGKICIFARNELALPDSTYISKIFIRNLFSLYNKSIRIEGRSMTKANLNNALSKTNLKNIQIIEDEGILIGIGNVE
ncbi:MAG: hypothetical protein ACFE96_02325 [Candidatus Hermodarchaeota archaeon]